MKAATINRLARDAGNGAKQVATAILEQKAKKGPKGEQIVSIPKIELKETTLTVSGRTSHIPHKWSVKNKRIMLQKHMQQADEPREAKDPEQDYRDSLYLDSAGRSCIPASAFKLAAVDACSFLPGITKVVARGAFYVLGDLIPVEKVKPHIREDIVRIGQRKPDIRYRGEHDENWECKLRILYNPRVMSIEQIANLLNYAGFCIGVGDWRPQKNGTHGMFAVKEG